MTHPLNIIYQARNLRNKGFSFEEIGKKFNVTKSTAYNWTNKIRLNTEAKERIRSRERIGLEKASLLLHNKRKLIINDISKRAKESIEYIKPDDHTNKIFCALLYWAEGAKTVKNLLTFINSDPVMIQVFLKLLRSSFTINEKKLRCLVHIHEYHNNDKIQRYWSQITGIPLSQFYRSYLKPHTKKRIRNNYHGTISLRYYDYKIALELAFLYNMFAKSIIIEDNGGVVQW